MVNDFCCGFSHILESGSLLCRDRYIDPALPFGGILTRQGGGLGMHVDALALDTSHPLTDRDMSLSKNLQTPSSAMPMVNNPSNHRLPFLGFWLYGMWPCWYASPGLDVGSSSYMSPSWYGAFWLYGRFILTKGNKQYRCKMLLRKSCENDERLLSVRLLS